MKQPPIDKQLIAWAKLPAVLDSSRQSMERMRQNGAFGPEILRLNKKLVVRRTELEAWVAAGLPDRASWQAMRIAEGRRLKIAGG
jgi:hypothetical protein